MSDPFSILGVDDTAGDEEIKRRYLALVRAFPPDREPERFQTYRAAFEALRDERKRLEAKLLATNEVALTRLKLSCLPPAGQAPGRASKASVAALLREGIERTAAGK
jgi:curved DNA-binding protein CbpA